MKTKRVKKVQSWTGYIILNAYGDPWSKEVFDTVGEAEKRMSAFWGQMENPPDMSNHQVVPARITPITSSRKK